MGSACSFGCSEGVLKNSGGHSTSVQALSAHGICCPGVLVKKHAQYFRVLAYRFRKANHWTIALARLVGLANCLLRFAAETPAAEKKGSP